MPESEPSEITQLLRAWRGGDDGALEKLLPLVHGQLRRIARSHLLAERADHTLQPTALVNELYLRICGGVDVEWTGRAHFYALASRTMRQVLVDHARRHRARRGNRPHQELDVTLPAIDARVVDVLALDAALAELQRKDPRAAQVVEMRSFGGMKWSEIAEVLRIGATTARDDWAYARRWLRRQLSS